MKPLIETLTIINPLGLHARAAAKLVKMAMPFESDVWLIKDDIEANGKSIMSLLLLAAGKDSSLTLKVEGPDQETAFAAIKKLITDGFGEMEK